MRRPKQSINERRVELGSQLDVLLGKHKEGLMLGDLFIKRETVEVVDASEYYVVPEYKLLVPLCVTAGDTFQVLAVELGNWALSESIEKYATCCNVVGAVLVKDAGYQVIPVLQEMLVTMPKQVLSPSVREAIRDARKRNNAISRKKHYPSGTLDLG